MNPIQLQNHPNQPAPPMPTLRIIEKELLRKFGQQKGNRIAAYLQPNYAALYARRPVLTTNVLQNHVDAKILPGLALYQSFLAEGMSQEAALNETEYVLIALAQQETRAISMIAHFPSAFWLLRRLMEYSMRSQYGAPGFEFHWVENSSNKIAFTITRCLYHNTLTAYGAPELTQVFCQLDDVWGAGLAPKILFERPHTIGRGGTECDFCYRLNTGQKAQKASVNSPQNG